MRSTTTLIVAEILQQGGELTEFVQLLTLTHLRLQEVQHRVVREDVGWSGEVGRVAGRGGGGGGGRRRSEGVEGGGEAVKWQVSLFPWSERWALH